ncbi:uncharacterized protein BDZ99DRAFT_458977, partial [Mytilinidion resinicola]
PPRRGFSPPARGILQSVILTGHSQPHAPTAYRLFTRLPSLSTNQAARSQLDFLTQGPNRESNSRPR